jgi:hypothetical protein
VLETTADLFNTLMLRLGYTNYLASSMDSGRDSPANIDYYLARLIGENFQDSCLGVHLIAPPLQAPQLGTQPLLWAKYGIAKFFHAPIWGYDKADFEALRVSSKSTKVKPRRWISVQSGPTLTAGPGYGTVGMVGLREPNSLAYALCDSPVGLLSLVCSALKRKSPAHALMSTEIIDITQLAWLPGPEAGMRFWAAAVSEVEELEAKYLKRSRVGVTVFGMDGKGEAENYVCPAWGFARHDIVFSQRVAGKAGLVVWERGDVVVDGIRGLANEVEKLDGRLKIRGLEEVVVSPSRNEEIPENENDGAMQLDVESPDTIVASNEQNGLGTA